MKVENFSNSGTTYSQEHETYNPAEDADYWDFSFDEMAKFDLPSTVDFILGETNNTELAYFGHSEGTMQMFIALSTLGSGFQKKISYFNAFGPVTYAGVIHYSIR